MKRRTALRSMVIITAGAALLPACRSTGNAGLALKNIAVNGKQQNMLAALSESIIPKTNNFLGAADLKAHEFVLTMVDDCTSPDDQQKFTDGLAAFNEMSHDKFGQLFTKFTPEEKKEFLLAIESKKDVPENVLNFYGTVRRYTIQSFTSSKDYMTTITDYKLVPGNNFKGCVKIV